MGSKLPVWHSGLLPTVSTLKWLDGARLKEPAAVRCRESTTLNLAGAARLLAQGVIGNEMFSIGSVKIYWSQYNSHEFWFSKRNSKIKDVGVRLLIYNFPFSKVTSVEFIVQPMAFVIHKCRLFIIASRDRTFMFFSSVRSCGCALLFSGVSFRVAT